MAMAFLEFRGNPYPPLRPPKKRNPDWIVNVLVREAVGELKASGVLCQVETEDATSRGFKEVEKLRTVLDNVDLYRSQSVDTPEDGTPV